MYVELTQSTLPPGWTKSAKSSSNLCDLQLTYSYIGRPKKSRCYVEVIVDNRVAEVKVWPIEKGMEESGVCRVDAGHSPPGWTKSAKSPPTSMISRLLTRTLGVQTKADVA